MKLCIFGGSFDPPHAGHLYIAQSAKASLNFDSLLWVPALDPPLKEKPGTPYSHRLAMVRLLIADEPGMEASEIESQLPHPSYSLNLIRALKDERGSQHDWHFLIGADNWLNFKQWHRWEEILQEVTLVVFPRGGVALEALPTGVENLYLPEMMAQATDIRDNLRRGMDPADAGVPAQILDYVRAQGLYGVGKSGTHL